MRPWQLIAALGWFHAPLRVAAGCLPDAIPENERTKMINVQGVEKPLGFVTNPTGASRWLTSVFEILASEVMGYATVNYTVGSTLHDFYKLSGCLNPETEFVEDMECGGTASDWHLSMEVRRPNETFMAENPGFAAVPVSSIGYVGAEGLMAFGDEVDAGWQADHLVFEYFKGFDADAFQTWQYFEDPSVIPEEDMALCSDTYIHSANVADWHVQFTGDAEGVETGPDGELRYKCWNGTWWLAPACRDEPWKCVVAIGDNTGYNLPAIMQQAASGNMPLAVGAAATWDKYIDLVLQYRVLAYWWLPGMYFAARRAVFVLFPLNDLEAWEHGDMRTFSPIRGYYKYAWHGLEAADFRVYSAVKNMAVTDYIINVELYLQNVYHETFYEAACRWVTTNSDVWRNWIPDPSDCTEGSGMIDAHGNFTSNTTYGMECRVCLSGMFSRQVAKPAGSSGRAFTYVCELCPVGQAQAAPGMGACDVCSPGKYSNAQGKRDCTLCQVGRFQATPESSRCEDCPVPYTTLVLGADSQELCVCPRDTYLILQGTCSACPLGMDCEANSAEANFPTLSGARSPACPSDTDEMCRYPTLLPKYYSSLAEPLHVFLCSSDTYCPGGDIQHCGDHMYGIACGLCDEGFARGDNHVCEECTDLESQWGFFPVTPLILAPAAILVLHSRSQDGHELWTSNAALLQGICQVGLMYLQTIAVINSCYIQAPAVWGDSTGWAAMSIEVMDAFKPVCSVMPDFRSTYVLKMLLPVLILIYFVATYIICRLILRATPDPSMLRKILDLKKDVLFHCYGSLLFTFYISIAAQALSLFQCYDHPNGERSLRGNPAVLCGSQEWQDVLVVAIFAVLVFCVLFLAVILWVLVVAPKRFNDERFRMRWKFLLMKFRPTCWWWGLVVIIKGLWLNLTTVTFHNAVDQVLWLNAGMVGYFCWAFTRQPWRCFTVTVMDLAEHAFLILLFGFLPYFVVEEVSLSRLGLVAAILCSIPVGATACVILYVLRNIFEEKRRQEGRVVRSESRSEASALLRVFAIAAARDNGEQVAMALETMAFADVMVLRRARDVLLTELATGVASPRMGMVLKHRTESALKGLADEESTPGPPQDTDPGNPQRSTSTEHWDLVAARSPELSSPAMPHGADGYPSHGSRPSEDDAAADNGESGASCGDSSAEPLEDMDFEVDVLPEGLRPACPEKLQRDAAARGASAWRERAP